MKKKRRMLLIGLLLILIIPYIWYMRQPMSKKDILKRVSQKKGRKYSVEELEVENLHKKMGVQLFRVEYSDKGGYSYGKHFLVKRTGSIEIMTYNDQFGDIVCTDYDGDHKYELVYLGSDPFTSGLVRPTLYVYEAQGGRAQLESAYDLSSISLEPFVLAAGEEGELYVYSEFDKTTKTKIQLKDGKWLFDGDLSNVLEMRDITQTIKDYIAYNQIELSDF